MKKFFIIFVALLLLPGCKANDPNKQNVNFEDKKIIEEESYEYGHGVVDYQFEKWSYDGQNLVFDYFINNIRQECEFGLVFLVDGICQTYEINGQKTSMYKVKMKANEEKKFTIKLTPEINSNKKLCNLNAFVILNPSAQIKEFKQYGHNHSISSTATINLELNSKAINDKIKVKSLNITYNDIPSNILKEYIKDNSNILNNNVYVEYVPSEDNKDNVIPADDPINIRVFGKKGNYNVLVVKDNVITDTYSTAVKENKYSLVTLDAIIKDTTNIYFLVVPIDVQDSHDYIMMNQSERYVVK